ncbi:hypothetical protein Dimus_039362 [Dionaea muscipula]
MAISSPLPHWIIKIRQEHNHCPELQQLSAKIQGGELLAPWELKDGVIFFRGRIYLPKTSPLIQDILSAFHDETHEGVVKLLHRLRAVFYWSGLKLQVKEFIRQCPVCQKSKAENCKPGGLLQPLPIPTLVWSDISMDFIEGLPPANGKSAIFVVVDRLSKYGHFIPIRHPFTAPQVAQIFFDQIVRLHGIPTSIVCDRDRVFTSLFWKELFKRQGVHFNFSSAYHPQTDGQTEVVNRTLKMYLRCFSHNNPKQWIKWLPWAEYCYNTSYHSATQRSPFEIVYGRPPPNLLQYIKGTSSVESVEHELLDRDQLLKEVRESLAIAQNRMKQVYDRRHQDKFFQIGDWVLLKLQPYRQLSLAARRNQKLGPKFFGPFRVLAIVGKVAYHLDLPADSRLHPIFHVSQLKRWIGDTNVTPTPLPPIELEQIIPLAILDHRETHGKEEVLVHWQHSSPVDATWESWSQL